MLFATMPEAPVDEDSHLLRGKDEIRRSGQPCARSVANDPGFAEVST